MAARSCDIMIGDLITIEEIVDRIQPEEFFDSLYPVLVELGAGVLQQIGQKHEKHGKPAGKQNVKTIDKYEKSVRTTARKQHHYTF